MQMFKRLFELMDAQFSKNHQFSFVASSLLNTLSSWLPSHSTSNILKEQKWH